MPYNTRSKYSTAFAEFDKQVHEIYTSSLSEKVNDVRIYKASKTASRLCDTLDELNEIVGDIRTRSGPQGPDAPWNPPVPSSSNQTNSGSDDLPQRRPSGKSKTDKSQKNGDKTDAELEKVSQELDQSKSALKDANKTIENLRDRLASEYKKNKKYAQAAEEFDQLAKLKGEEVKQKQKKKDGDGARHVEDGQLKYVQQKGEMLLQATRPLEAESAFRLVLERRKTIDDRHNRQTIRAAQLLLCTALRAQNSASKIQEAEELYYREALLTHLETQNETERTWAIRNAFELAIVNAETGSYGDMISQLREVWPLRVTASAECQKQLDNSISGLVQLLRARRQESSILKVLAITNDGQRPVSTGLSGHIKEQCNLLMQQGKYKEVLPHLRQMWVTTPRADSAETLSIGWSFACTLCHLNQYPEAKGILDTILPLGRPNKTLPSDLEIRALLAYCHLQLNNLKDAESHARTVYDKRGTATFPTSSHFFNQADTLIRTLIRHNHRDQYGAAYEVWKRVNSDCLKINVAAANPNGREQFKAHLQVGRELLAAWMKSARARNVKNPKRPGEIRAQITRLEKMIA